MTAEKNKTKSRPRNLVVFSDGTGNRAGQGKGTNVWRMYEALDRRLPDNDDPIQLAAHDDGVGTSGNKVLKILGGAFGYGLAANVRELYIWLAKTYRPGDKIFMFGFSRGAFTVRCLASMIAKCGVMKIDGVSRKEIEGRASAAWMAYKLTQRPGSKAAAEAEKFKADQAVPAGDDPNDHDVRIEFIGVWDTVDAYGLPVDEAKDSMAVVSSILIWIPWMRRLAITRFKDYRLSPLVNHAYHAIALDDERHTFHPVLWDESKKLEGQTIEQVWFSGMHSDVGGGYIRGSLSLEPLHWMMTCATKRGLRLLSRHVQKAEEERSAEGPMHDSRAGGGVFYRYRPRDVEELCEEHHVRVKVHASVLERVDVTKGADAPKGLPGTFEVVGSTEANDALRPDISCLKAHRGVDFWRRTLYASFLVLVLFVLWRSLQPPVTPLPGWGYLGDLIDWASAGIPDVLLTPINSLRSQPFTVFVASALLFVMARLRTWLRRHSQKLRREAWHFTESTSKPWWIALGRAISRSVRSLTQSLGIAYGLLATAVIAAILTLVLFVYVGENPESSVYPRPTELKKGESLENIEFDTRDRVGRTNLVLLAGRKYEFKVTVTEAWTDGDVAKLKAGPGGLTDKATPEMGWLERFRCMPSENWMVLLGSVGACDADPFVIGKGGTITATVSGRLYLYVNDAVWYWKGGPLACYENNAGRALITVRRVD